MLVALLFPMIYFFADFKNIKNTYKYINFWGMILIFFSTSIAMSVCVGQIVGMAYLRNPTKTEITKHEIKELHLVESQTESIYGKTTSLKYYEWLELTELGFTPRKERTDGINFVFEEENSEQYIERIKTTYSMPDKRGWLNLIVLFFWVPENYEEDIVIHVPESSVVIN